MSTETVPTTAAPALVIEDTDEPVAYTRTSAPNPFAEKVAAMAAEWDEKTGRSKRSAKLTVPADKSKTYSRQLRDAVRAIGRGIRLSEEKNADGSVTLHFQVATLKVGPGRPKAPAAPKATK